MPGEEREEWRRRTKVEWRRRRRRREWRKKKNKV